MAPIGMGLDLNGTYESVILNDTQKDAIKPVITNWVESILGSETDEKKRTYLSKLASGNYLNQCVGYIQENLPAEVDRVDGSGSCNIKCMLKEVINEQLALLPVLENPEV